MESSGSCLCCGGAPTGAACPRAEHCGWRHRRPGLHISSAGATPAQQLRADWRAPLGLRLGGAWGNTRRWTWQRRSRLDNVYPALARCHGQSRDRARPARAKADRGPVWRMVWPLGCSSRSATSRRSWPPMAPFVSACGDAGHRVHSGYSAAPAWLPGERRRQLNGTVRIHHEDETFVPRTARLMNRARRSAACASSASSIWSAASWEWPPVSSEIRCPIRDRTPAPCWWPSSWP